MAFDDIYTRTPSQSDSPAPFHRPKVTAPVTWLAAVVMLVAVAGILAWCFTGTITRSVQITGVVFPQYGIEQVTSEIDGLVSYVQVEVGDLVEAGDLIAIVPQGELLEQLRQAQEAQAPQDENQGLYAAYQAASMVYTPVSGRVVELVETGSRVQAGEVVAGITSADIYSNEAEIRAYVPSAVAQSIQKGMEVRVYPSTSASEEYGYVQGLISDISSYPITEADISDALGRFYTGEIVPQDENILEVRVTLLAGAEEAAGTWSRAEGGSLSIDTGTLCRMQVVVSEMTAWEYLRS